MQRKLAWDNRRRMPPAFDDDAWVCVRFPALPPPGEVISLRVNFRDVRLSQRNVRRYHGSAPPNLLEPGLSFVVSCGKCDEINTREHKPWPRRFFSERPAGARVRSRHATIYVRSRPFTPE